MRGHHQHVGILLVIATLAVSGCSAEFAPAGAAPSPEPVEGDATDPNAVSVDGPADPVPQAAPSQRSAPEETAPPDIPPRPGAPAGTDAGFRPDSPLQVAATDSPQLIEFFAFWCTTCNAMKPMVHGLEAEYWSQIDFVYLDIDDPSTNPVKERYGFRSQPTFVLIAPDGTPIQTWFGYVDADEFRRAFDDYLAASS